MRFWQLLWQALIRLLNALGWFLGIMIGLGIIFFLVNALVFVVLLGIEYAYKLIWNKDIGFDIGEKTEKIAGIILGIAFWLAISFFVLSYQSEIKIYLGF